MGKDVNREFAPNKRNPDDKYKVTVKPSEPKYDVGTDPNSNRPVVTKKEESND